MYLYSGSVSQIEPQRCMSFNKLLYFMRREQRCQGVEVIDQRNGGKEKKKETRERKKRGVIERGGMSVECYFKVLHDELEA